MPTFLRIDASSRRSASVSREIGDAVEKSWRAAHPGGRVTVRDVADGTIPVIAQKTVEGFYTAPEDLDDDLRAAIALSDALIAEVQAADVLLITSPIYNFSVPSALKAWIDQVVRINRTFSYDGEAFTGLARPERAILVCAYGAEGYLDGEGFAAANFLEPYLRFLMGFLGIGEVETLSIQATTGAPEPLAAQKAALAAAARGLFA